MYLDKVGHSFLFDHCWNLLRTQPKWLQKCEKKNSKKDNSSCTPNSINLGEGGVPFDSNAELERPPGRKYEKEKLKKQKTDTAKGSCFAGILNEMKEGQEKMNEERTKLFEKVYLQENERLLFEQETKKETSN